MVNAEAGQRVTLRRLVLAGERRRVDLVLPAHEPIGALLPEILRAADDRAAHEPPTCRLVTAGGAVLARSETLASANVADGSVVRLVREHGAAEVPAGRGVVGETAGGRDGRDKRGGHGRDDSGGGHEGRDDRGGYVRQWDERSRTGVAVVAAVLLTVVVGVFAGDRYGLDRAALWLGLAAVVAAGAGAAAGLLLPRKASATALLLVGGTLGVFASWGVTPGGAPRLAAAGLTVAAVLALLGLCTGLGRGGLVGAAAVAVAAGAWAIGLAVADPARTGAVLGVVSILVLGYLPRLALASAGLTRLDGRHSGGAPVSRYRAAAALGATHRGLTLAAVTTAGSAGAAGVLAVSGTGGASGTADGWTVAVALLLSVVLFSRARAYPLVLEVMALLVAGAAVCVRLVLLWGADGGNPAAALTVLCLLAVLPLAALAVRPPEHVRLRVRHLMNVVESVSVVALIPVALGALGVYGGLPDMF
ncbi:EsaB/YukD family protein [Streptomyces chrestomyceticus]|uniref:EsaB/YukD family protein n=1 Tax=Streptomyces chrestomyceticus TaxID=68185 RepID=UPI0019CFDC5F|nr:EsaB/YukD family protein [Streptomyces chrestomyceticus]